MPAPTIAQVRGWDPARLDVSAVALRHVEADLDHEIRTLQTAMDGAARSWTGAASDAAAARVSQEAELGRRMSAAFEAARLALSRGSAQLTATRSHLLSLVGDAQACGFSVADDGTVTAPSLPPVVTAPGDTAAAAQRDREQQELDARAQDTAAAVAQALSAVLDADRTTATALAQVEIPASMTTDVELFLERLRTSGDLMTALGSTAAGGLALATALKKAWGIFGKTKAFSAFVGSTAGQLREYPGAVRFVTGSEAAADAAAFARFARLGGSVDGAMREFQLGKTSGLLARVPGLGTASRAAGKAFLPLTVVTGLADTVTGGGYDGARGWATRGFGLAGAAGAGTMLAMSAGVLATNPVGWAVAGAAVLGYGVWSGGSYVYDHWGQISDFAGKAAGWVGDQAQEAGHAVTAATAWAGDRLGDAADAAGQAVDATVDTAKDAARGTLHVVSLGLL